jgi:hypothetical protein
MQHHGWPGMPYQRLKKTWFGLPASSLMPLLAASVAILNALAGSVFSVFKRSSRRVR